MIKGYLKILIFLAIIPIFQCFSSPVPDYSKLVTRMNFMARMNFKLEKYAEFSGGCFLLFNFAILKNFFGEKLHRNNIPKQKQFTRLKEVYKGYRKQSVLHTLFATVSLHCFDILHKSNNPDYSQIPLNR